MMANILDDLENCRSVLLVGSQSPAMTERIKATTALQSIITIGYADYISTRGHASLSDYLKTLFEKAVFTHPASLVVVEEIEELLETTTSRMDCARLMAMYSGKGIKLLAFCSSQQTVFKECFDSSFDCTSKDEGNAPGTENNHNVRAARWEEIGGMRATKEAVWRSATALIDSTIAGRYQEIGCHPATGILLHGPPGTGKTLIARALATELKCSFFAASLGQLLHAHVGESEHAIADLFQHAASAEPAAIVFLDELDALFSGGGMSGMGRKMAAQLIAEFDELLRRGRRGPGARVLVIAATNHIGCVDKRLIRYGRFEVVLKVELPDAAERHDIVRVLASIGDGSLVEELVRKSKGMSGADIAQVIQLARQRAHASRNASLELLREDFADLFGQQTGQE